jgi:uncharacterized protein (TIGR02452 family)
MVYSPGVPVFRDHEGRLLDAPYRVSFITAPAVNAGAVRRNEPENEPLIEPTLRQRVARVLWLARTNGHVMLILGAWGCGVFGNEPEMIARLFRQQLTGAGPFRGQFGWITFAVYDRSPEHAVLTAFQRALNNGS